MSEPQSETSAARQWTVPFCIGNGIDVGSGGDPVVPWAIQIDLPATQFDHYGHAHLATSIIQWRMEGIELPFKDGTLDFCYASHLLEDFEDWTPVLKEWLRVLKPGGHLIIMLPDHKLFRAAVAGGQGDNLSHKHEGCVGELSERLRDRVTVITDRITHGYNILFVGQKL